jgi:hypothetical protein
LALGAFALALHSGYQRGEFPFFHRIQAHASAELCRIAAHAEQTYATARLLTSGVGHPILADDFTGRRQAEIEQTRPLRQTQTNRAMMLRQAEVSRDLALRQADLARMQKIQHVRIVMENARFESLSALEHMRVNLSEASDRHTVVICRLANAQIAVNSDSDSIDPDVETPTP